MFDMEHKLDYLWTWGGVFFGFRQENQLWTYTGHHIGIFEGNTIFGLKGHYLGEIVNNRLLVNDTRKVLRAAPLAELPKHPAIPKPADLEGLSVCRGFEDFPPPEMFEKDRTPAAT